MKIATITCNNADNYGARLQTFALYRYLTDLGYDVEVIDYMPSYMTFKTSQFYFPGFNLKEWVKLFVQYRHRKRAILKHKRLNEFSKTFTKLTKTYYSIDDLKNNPPLSDIYIAGSDQIWNPDFPNGSDPAFYLNFGPSKVKRISYAASFAIPSLPAKYRNSIANMLNEFDSISVRELSAIEILRNLGINGVQVCDPVWLLDEDYWSQNIADSTGENDKYLLIYDFMHNGDLQVIAQRTARLRRLKIYSVSPRLTPYADKNFCDCSPETFVALSKNASCIISNSLHGSLFAMLFKKDFYVVNRPDGLNQRMADLLSQYSISNRIVDRDCKDSRLVDRIDYSNIISVMNTNIEKSKEWLHCQF